MSYASYAPVAPRRLTLGQLWFSFSGRASRFDNWVRFTVLYLVGGVIAGGLDRLIPLYTMTVTTDAGPQLAEVPLFSTLYGLVCIWPSLAVAVKRCHDRNHSGWYFLFILIPLVGPIWMFVELGFLRGTVGPNRFGPDPVG